MNKKEPFIRIVKRDELPMWKVVLIKGVAIIIALAISAIFIYSVTKLNPLEVFSAMIDGAFGTNRRIWNTLRDTGLLLLIAVGLAPAFKMKFWNTGAEGQVLMGGLVTAAIMIKYADVLPTWLMLVVMLIASLIAGAAWGFLPAFFKAKFKTNETLFTLMMNYVAIQLVEFFVDVWDKKESHSVGIINLNTQSGWFPSILGQQYLLNIIIVAVVTIFVFIYLKYTKHGYEVEVVGESENTAKYAGINVTKVTIRTMLVSGAICGLAGFVEVAGISHTISKSTAGGRGFTAIIVAWLAKLNPIVMVLYSFILVVLDKGAVQIASEFNLNEYASDIITSILLFCILGSEFFVNYKMVFRSKEVK